MPLEGTKSSERPNTSGEEDSEMAMDVGDVVAPSTGMVDDEDVEMEQQDITERTRTEAGGEEGQEGAAREDGESCHANPEGNADGDVVQQNTASVDGIDAESTPENDLVTWDKIWNFSYDRLDRIGWKYAPIMSTITTGYTNPTNPLDDLFSRGRVLAVRGKYCPTKLVCLFVMDLCKTI